MCFWARRSITCFDAQETLGTSQVITEEKWHVISPGCAINHIQNLATVLAVGEDTLPERDTSTDYSEIDPGTLGNPERPWGEDGVLMLRCRELDMVPSPDDLAS